MTVAAVLAATTVVSFSLASCQGRKMDNMQPKGETVEVDIMPAPEEDSIEITVPETVEAVATLEPERINYNP